MALRFLLLTLIIGSMVVGASCGDETHHNPPPTSRAPVVRDNVRILDESLRDAIVGVDAQGTLVLSNTSAVPEWSVGDIIVSAPTPVLPLGMLRKIVTLTPNGTGLTVETDPAYLYQVFKEATLDANVKFDPVDLLQQPRTGYPRAELSLGHVIKDLDGNLATTNDQIRLNGNFSLDIDAGLHWQIFDASKIFDDLNPFDSIDLELGLSAGVVEDVNVSLTLPGGNYDGVHEIEVADYWYATQVIMVGPVPVTITPRIRVVAGVGASGSVVPQTLGAHQWFNFSVGAECSIQEGCGAHKNFGGPGFDVSGPNLSAQHPFAFGINGYIEARPEILFYWSAGPYVTLEPNVLLTAASPGSPIWDLNGGMYSSIGIAASIFDLDWSTTVIDESWNISEASNTPPTIKIVSPKNNAKVQLNAPVQFFVSHYDLEQGGACCTVQLVSDIDGPLGNANNLGVLWQTFSTSGARHITATVTDSGGTPATASIDIVVQNAPPDATITQPWPNATYYRSVPFIILGSAKDANEPNGTLPCSSIVWGAQGANATIPTNRCGAATDGTQIATFHSNGARSLTLTATDSQSASDIATVNFSIVDPPSNIPPNVVVLEPNTENLSINADGTGQQNLKIRVFDPDDATVDYTWRAYWYCLPGTKICQNDFLFLSGSLGGASNQSGGQLGAVKADVWDVFSTLPNASCGSSYDAYLEIFVDGAPGSGQTQIGFPFRVTSSPC